jgi:exopolysaccharide biosynthesis polyprenyl glycosylphosphotransferase
MKNKDSLETGFVAWALTGDALALFGAFMLAVWLRFDSNLFAVRFGRIPDLYEAYARGGLVFALIGLWICARLGLYRRPQRGRFESKIPRLARACGLTTLASAVLAFAVRNYVMEFSTGVLALSLPTGVFCLLAQRYVLFRIELHCARHSRAINRVLILGTGEVAARLRRGLIEDRKLRTEVVGFLRCERDEPRHESLDPQWLLGTLDDLEAVVANPPKINQIILAGTPLGHARIVEIILLCERHLVQFNMVPDLFQVLTGSMNVQSVDDIPLLGVAEWPLDRAWNRFLKRTEDLLVAAVGLLATLPIMAAAAYCIRRSSPGSVLYRQERCGKDGRVFTLYKLRTMVADAESRSGPVWAARDDARRTPVGAFLRRCNLDELPQFWNVLTGDMSVVGPRPERPHFVEKFKSDVGRYMWRHVSKPGITGWAQVNGLRGDTDIEERIKYDLYYLEHWSLSFDLKILLKTFFARENAY